MGTIAEEDTEPIHGWFELTYASYLVIPRSVLQSLPVALQRGLVDALEAIERHIRPAKVPIHGHYEVQLRDSQGRFISDPLRDYERGRRRISREDLLLIEKVHWR